MEAVSDYQYSDVIWVYWRLLYHRKLNRLFNGLVKPTTKAITKFRDNSPVWGDFSGHVFLVVSLNNLLIKQPICWRHDAHVASLWTVRKSPNFPVSKVVNSKRYCMEIKHKWIHIEAKKKKWSLFKSAVSRYCLNVTICLIIGIHVYLFPDTLLKLGYIGYCLIFVSFWARIARNGSAIMMLLVISILMFTCHTFCLTYTV